MARTIGKNSTLKLYKFIPFKYVKRILANGRMPIGRIDAWEDSYENYFLKNTFTIGINPFDLKKISQRFYGLCLTSLNESDALWRIYSDISGFSTGRADAADNTAIRVCISPQMLYQLVPFRPDVTGKSYIESVRYISKNDIEAELLAGNPYSLDDIADKTKQSFFTKRVEFSHEKEVRYIFITSRFHKAKSIEMSLNPLTFFDEFTIDPRLSRNQFCAIRRELEALHIPTARINQSDLYKFDPKSLQINI